MMNIGSVRDLIGAACFVSLFSFILSASPAGAADPSFEEFAVKLYSGPVSAPDLDSDPEARTYRTRLNEAAKGPVNFAGKYILTTWGCGTTCLHGAVMNAETGRVTFLPNTICCWETTDDDFKPVRFRPDSDLIVFSGLLGEEDPMARHYFEFFEDRFLLLKTVPSAPDFRTDLAPPASPDPNRGSASLEPARNPPGYAHALLRDACGSAQVHPSTANGDASQQRSALARRAGPAVRAAINGVAHRTFGSPRISHRPVSNSVDRKQGTFL